MKVYLRREKFPNPIHPCTLVIDGYPIVIQEADVSRFSDAKPDDLILVESGNELAESDGDFFIVGGRKA